MGGWGHMEELSYDKVKRTTWRVDVLDRLVLVMEDVTRAVNAAGWALSEDTPVPKIGQNGKDDTGTIQLKAEAQAVVNTTYKYITKTKETLKPPATRRQRLWDMLAGDTLMSAYTSLHAAEANRVLLFSSVQLAAFLPSIRQRAVAFLPASDPNRGALDLIPDPTTALHQATMARANGQASRANGQGVGTSDPAAHTGPPEQQDAKAPAADAAGVAGAAGKGPEATAVTASDQAVTTDKEPENSPEPVANEAQDDPQEPDANAGKVDAPQPDGGNSGPGNPPAEGVAPPAGNDQGAGKGKTAGGTVPGQGAQPPPPPSGGGPGPGQGPGANLLTGLLGADQQVAAQVFNAACRAEDQQQLQVRHFRGVLYGTAAALFIVVAVLWIVGSLHPKYFPICWPTPSAQHPMMMICPNGGSQASVGNMPLVLGMGGIGAVLSVATNLAGLKPAGVRFSLTVAQGLLKIALGAITALLGIILLRTQTNAPGFLASQAGLLTTAVVFGYSQQVFTRLVDRQANTLMDAASTKTPAADPSVIGRRSS